MANKEALKFQEALANKIKDWEATEDFASGKYNRQKLNRSLNLLLGSDPEIVIDMLGGDFVPNNPREAMNLIRGLDLRTLKSMEILELTGKGNKLVGHHGIAASTLQILRHMPPKERLKVYKGLADMGQRFGMDPRQIFLIADKIHESIAHEGDYSGVKPGVQLPYIVGETGDEFLKRFEAPMKQQLAALERAVNHADTQGYYKAINVLEDNLQFPRGTLTNPNTPIVVKDAATKLFKNVSPQIRDVVTGGGDITKGTQAILDQTEFKEKPLNRLFELAQASGIVEVRQGSAKWKGTKLYSLDPISMALMENPTGAAVGTLMDAYNKETIQKLEQGDVIGAGKDVLKGAVTGAAIESGAKILGPKATSVLGNVVAPVVGASLFTEGREGSTTDYVLDKYGKYVGMNQNRPSWGTEFGEMRTQKPGYVQATEDAIDTVSDFVVNTIRGSAKLLFGSPKPETEEDLNFTTL